MTTKCLDCRTPLEDSENACPCGWKRPLRLVVRDEKIEEIKEKDRIPRDELDKLIASIWPNRPMPKREVVVRKKTKILESVIITNPDAATVAMNNKLLAKRKALGIK